jgi:hypothetical protein
MKYLHIVAIIDSVFAGAICFVTCPDYAALVAFLTFVFTRNTLEN